MKIARFCKDEKIFYGEVNGNLIRVLRGEIEEGFEKTDKTFNLQEVKLLSPVDPCKILCIGLNYLDHIDEFGLSEPKEPVIFMKPQTAVIASGEAIRYPKISKRVDYEAELAIVIGERVRNINEAEASKYILGYTCANDITARDFQEPHGQWTVAKGFDSFLPLGPFIETDINVGELDIKCLLNGKIVQESNTKHLLFNPNKLVSYISSIMTLLPGDVILTGTPSGVGPLSIGDEIVVEIEGIGKLTNTVKNDDFSY